MKRAVWLVLGALTLGWAWRLRCRTGEGHRPTRHVLGGYRCPTCGCAFRDLEEAGQMYGRAYVDPLRRGAVQHGTERAAR